MVSNADAFARALQLGDPAIVRSALAHDINVNERDSSGRPPIINAVSGGVKEVVQLLLSAGASIDASDRESGATALHIAAATPERNNLVESLVKAGANTNLSFGDPPVNALGLALRNGSYDLARLLLNSGADPNATVNMPGDSETQVGLAALCYAAGRGDLVMAQALMSKGADVNQAKGDGMTPLMMAAVAGHMNLVQTLLEHDADTSIAIESLTADKMAEASNHVEIAHLIRANRT